MRILAFNCSPRAEHSNTERILKPLLDGAREAGAETETVYVSKEKLGPCRGCMSCMFRTPGECVQKDDRAALAERFERADVAVFGTPVFVFSMSAHMKKLLERLIFPMVRPYYVKVGDGFGHPVRDGGDPTKMLLVANGGFWGEQNFAPLEASVRQLCDAGVVDDGRPVSEYAGSILVGNGVLLEAPGVGYPLRPFFEKLKAAGAELAADGALSDETQESLRAPLWTYLGMDEEQALASINDHIRQMEPASD